MRFTDFWHGTTSAAWLTRLVVFGAIVSAIVVATQVLHVVLL